MSPTCQHCGCPSTSINVCNECLRSRPIAWKATVWSIACEANLEGDLVSQDTTRRQKANHPLHSMASRQSKDLMGILQFDAKFYQLWKGKKDSLQGSKGGGGSYIDSCRQAVREFVASEVSKGRLVINGLKRFLNGEAVKENELGWNEVKSIEEISPWEIKYRNQCRKNQELRSIIEDMRTAAENSSQHYLSVIASLNRLISSHHTSLWEN